MIEAGFNPAFFGGSDPQGSPRALALYFEVVEAFEGEPLVAYDATLARAAAVGGQAEGARGD